ncbi:efflux RND transporter permease subunit [Candidatus Magnetominusculus xianensis]|uniref:Multidrug transporter n=1 Tax=Candidatus Magnetominusculus xianensis TaxID=1748249 RepID=A0ABR5SE95_9BACT|nr:efflux RND transporter permease subunit [Candidatus Magnetominusculus xianensis]KWT84128.1 multidrug transporter [Candidatus Magnetominusculus xianensis]MBF0402422.1 efflux RND transporter permease subunit [Nitrospirota bacterium]
MNLSEIWIKRPVMTTLVMCSLLFFGIAGYKKLPVNNLPTVDFPTIQVSVNFPGANAETMASTVATPLERQFTQIAGLEQMTSSSSTGKTSITLQFSLDRNIDAAAQDVNSYIAAAAKDLPSALPYPPTYKKVNPADNPVVYIAISSDTLRMSQVDEYAETFISEHISMLNGVSQVLVYGAQKFAVRVRVDPSKLVSAGVGLDQVKNAISAGNVNLPNGIIDSSYQQYSIQSNGQLFSAAGYLPLIVAYRNGSPVRIQDIGTAEDDVENNRTAAWFKTKDKADRSIVIVVKRQPGSNTVEVADSIMNLIPKLKSKLPASLNMKVFYNQADYIRESAQDVQYTLVFTIFLVIMIIYVFLRSAMATVIPGIAVPLSIVGTFCVMYVLNYSLNNLTLMALTLSAGFVVDDAVVVLENIFRRMEHGEPAMKAALDGSKEISFTVLSMTISLVVVFIPIMFMSGIIGKLFREFAVSIGVAILVSGFISLTLTPMLCSRFLRHGGKTRDASNSYYERVFDSVLKVYGSLLKSVLKHRYTMLVFTLIIMAATVFLFIYIKKGFIPGEDQNYFRGVTMASESISFQDMVRHQQTISEIARKEPDVESLISVVAPMSLPGANSGILFVTLSNSKDRKRSVDQIIAALRPKLNSVVGLRAFLQNPPVITIGGQVTNALYQFTLQSVDLKELYKYGDILTHKVREIDGLTDVSNDIMLNSPRINVEVDRDKASALGLTLNSIQDTLYSAYGTRQVSTIYTDINQYQVILEVEPKYQLDPSALSLLYIRSDDGRMVPLYTVAKITMGSGPLVVNHTAQLPSATISFNLQGTKSIGDAVLEITKIAKETLPVNITTSFQGSAQEFQKSITSMGILLLITILIIYVVLGILYESFIHPITILTSLPLAGFGALGTLMLFKMELDVYAFVGVVMLVGLVKKNGIMMVDFALQLERENGENSVDSIYHACMIRFRPIMMTTMAALFGTLPIALGIGAGGDARRPLGVAVIGGLFFSQMLTLFVTPVFYVYMDKFNRWITKDKGH